MFADLWNNAYVAFLQFQGKKNLGSMDKIYI